MYLGCVIYPRKFELLFIFRFGYANSQTVHHDKISNVFKSLFPERSFRIRQLKQVFPDNFSIRFLGCVPRPTKFKFLFIFVFIFLRVYLDMAFFLMQSFLKSVILFLISISHVSRLFFSANEAQHPVLCFYLAVHAFKQWNQIKKLTS